MEVDVIKALSFLLVFVPGYIFIHTLDYHLLKGEKSQFEKTVQAILSSAMIWTLFIIFPFQPLNDKKESIVNLVLLLLKSPENKFTLPLLLDRLEDGLVLFVLLCVYSFVLATAYAIFRKFRLTGHIIQLITRRDYFKEVALRFYSEGLNHPVIVTMKNKNRYLGTMIGTPDQVNDHKIILYEPFVQSGQTWEKLIANRLLVDTNDLDLIELRMEESNHAGK